MRARAHLCALCFTLCLQCARSARREKMRARAFMRAMFYVVSAATYYIAKLQFKTAVNCSLGGFFGISQMYPPKLQLTAVPKLQKTAVWRCSMYVLRSYNVRWNASRRFKRVSEAFQKGIWSVLRRLETLQKRFKTMKRFWNASETFQKRFKTMERFWNASEAFQKRFKPMKRFWNASEAFQKRLKAKCMHETSRDVSCVHFFGFKMFSNFFTMNLAVKNFSNFFYNEFGCKIVSEFFLHWICRALRVFY